MYITEDMILQHLYWNGIRDTVMKELTNYDKCQHKKHSNKKYGKLPAKGSEKIPWNKLCVDLIGPYIIKRKGYTENLNLRAITMIEPVTG